MSTIRKGKIPFLYHFSAGISEFLLFFFFGLFVCYYLSLVQNFVRTKSHARIASNINDPYLHQLISMGNQPLKSLHSSMSRHHLKANHKKWENKITSALAFISNVVEKNVNERRRKEEKKKKLSPCATNAHPLNPA